MSGSLSISDYGALNRIVANTQQVKQQIAKLTEQTSTGLVDSNFAGLGIQAGTALDLSAQIAGNTGLQANADAAANVQSVTQKALGQIESIASSFAASAIAVQTTTGGTAALAASARDALSQVAALLNTKIGDVYVFAGQDSGNPPVPSGTAITSSAFYTAIQTAVAGLSVNGGAAVAAQTLAIASPGGTSPFSATLEASPFPATADFGGGHRIQIGVLATQNTDAVSAGTGTTSTGSYTRDILQNLATIGSLTAAQANDPNFQPFVAGAVGNLQNAVSAINTDIGGLGARQADVTATKTELADTATSLTTQLAGIQEVDYTQVATKLSAAQTQLQASYQVIAALGQLSLAKFLPAA